MEKLHSLKFTKVNTTIFVAIFTALSVALPVVVHFFAGAAGGRLFLPMHFFIFLAALLLGWRAGLAVGILTPLISYSLTRMPIANVLPLILIELSLYGFLTGYLHKNRKWDVFSSLLGAMVSGRLLLLGAIAILPIKISAISYVFSALQAGLIGIAMQLILVPLIYTLAAKYIKNDKI